MNNTTAKQYIKGYGLQWGMLGVYRNLGLNSSLKIGRPSTSAATTRSVDRASAGHPREHRGSGQPAPNDHAYAEESWTTSEWIKLGVNSYSAWNMVLDTERGR